MRQRAVTAKEKNGEKWDTASSLRKESSLRGHEPDGLWWNHSGQGQQVQRLRPTMLGVVAEGQWVAGRQGENHKGPGGATLTTSVSTPSKIGSYQGRIMVSCGNPVAMLGAGTAGTRRGRCWAGEKKEVVRSQRYSEARPTGCVDVSSENRGVRAAWRAAPTKTRKMGMDACKGLTCAENRRSR